MMLLIDGIYKGKYHENVTYWIQSLESGFELLTQLAANQWRLTTVILVDKGDCMSLPVEAFDGQPIQIHLGSLQQEWTQLLSAKPQPYRSSGAIWPKDWYERLDDYYRGLLAYLAKMILLLESRKRKVLTYRDEKVRFLLSDQYDLQLNLNKRLYQQTQKNRQKNQHRLLALEK